ncbi:putative cation transporter [Thermohydrogenium kirishiense]|nr:putative cation transporter [Thermohydrogenium kirishiense]
MINAILFAILLIILTVPFFVKAIEDNIEYFLFAMGIIAVTVSGAMSLDLLSHILKNHLLYIITAAVFISGLLFEIFKIKIKEFVKSILNHISLKIFVFMLIVVLGLTSSIITAIVASLVLVEIVHILPIHHKDKVVITVIACLSIGLGAALTPVGEPLSTLVISALKKDFFYLLRTIGIYIVPAIFVMGILGAFYVNRFADNAKPKQEEEYFKEEEMEIRQIENIKFIVIRSIKIFIFLLALELLSAGFKPLVDNYIIHMDVRFLYWVNMISAVLDNATLAAAEISPAMDPEHIRAILMGLLISGGMLIPGNIPNIISAGKLEIKSREWAKIGIPLSMITLIVCYFIVFI